MKVRDIMTHEVVTLSEDSTLDSAAWTFVSESVTGAPVRDAGGNVIGVLSRSDLIDPSRHGEMDVAVREVMTAGVWAVHPDDAAIEAVKLMVEADVHRVIVVSGPGQLEGIVTTMDIMRALVGGGDFHGLGEAARSPEPRKVEEAETPERKAAEMSA